MSLINFGKGSSQKPVAHANTPVEVQPRPQVDPARQKRAELARAAERQWLEAEAQIDQLEAERDEWRRRAEAAEFENERLLEREAAAYQRLDEEKEGYREALATAMAAFAATAPMMLDAHRKISAVIGSPSKIDMPALAQRIKEHYPPPSILQQGPASQS